MTFLGRIFVFIILILSIVFMALAINVTATHRNWRDLVLNPETGLKLKVEALETQVKQLNDRLVRARDDLAIEQASRRTSLAVLQTRADQYQQELQTASANALTLQGQVSEMTNVDNQRTEELTRLSQDNSNLRNQVTAERRGRDELFQKATDIADQLTKYRGQTSNLTERNEQLLQQLTQFKEVIDKLGVNPADPLDGAPPARTGMVIAVMKASNTVEVSIGYDEGIREGHLLDVTRAGRYITKLRVKSTRPDRAVAEILTDFRLGSIQEGDRVSTTLK
jgi:hypothetical protein